MTPYSNACNRKRQCVKQRLAFHGGGWQFAIMIKPGMRLGFCLLVLMAMSVTEVQAATNEVPLATVNASGQVAVVGGMVVPMFPKLGIWRELPGKSSDRYDTQHFMYAVRGQSPSIELYVCADRSGEAADGAFEMGLVRGFIDGLGGKAGLKHDPPEFDERRIGSVKWKHTLVKFEKDQHIVWVHGYIFVHNPSITFIAIRSKEADTEDLEKYLADVKTE